MSSEPWMWMDGGWRYVWHHHASSLSHTSRTMSNITTPSAAMAPLTCACNVAVVQVPQKLGNVHVVEGGSGSSVDGEGSVTTRGAWGEGQGDRACHGCQGRMPGPPHTQQQTVIEPTRWPLWSAAARCRCRRSSCSPTAPRKGAFTEPHPLNFNFS